MRWKRTVEALDGGEGGVLADERENGRFHDAVVGIQLEDWSEAM